MTQPRGIRNNNPGNIRWGDPWQGLVSAQQRTDRDFCQFTAPAWGIRALCRVLITYADNYNLRTVREIIGRWAPPSENDTSAYIAAVAGAMGVGADDVIDTHAYATLLPLAKAIIRHENGAMPYDQQTLNEGMRLAGVVRPIKSPVQTRRGAAVAVAGSAGLTAAALEGYNQVAPIYSALSAAAAGGASGGQWIRLAAAALVLASIAASIYAYWRHHKAVAVTRS